MSKESNVAVRSDSSIKSIPLLYVSAVTRSILERFFFDSKSGLKLRSWEIVLSGQFSFVAAQIEIISHL